MTKPKAKRKGIVVWIGRHRLGESGFISISKASAEKELAMPSCYHNRSRVLDALVRAGMKPLKPGESRKIRVVIEEP